MTYKILNADCLEAMRQMPDNSVDSIVTDPPYGLSFMGKHWDHGVPGKDFWVEALRIAKPGAHIVAFGGSRTYHRLAVAIEDAGWQIRDSLMWLYGSGFPKSHNIGKAIDKEAGKKREVVGRGKSGGSSRAYQSEEQTTAGEYAITAPATDAAKQWDGWGTALKPAHEPIVLARKPLIGTVAQNVLEHGTGGLNIDGCRIEYASDADKESALAGDAFKRKDVSDAGWSRPWMSDAQKVAEINTAAKERAQAGRWPANILFDEEAAEILDEQSGLIKGGASRFFYTAKAGKAERNAGLDGFEEKRPDNRTEVGMGVFEEKGVAKQSNHHPTVKPIDIMRYLCRLITPPGGTVLDPFNGSGSTGCAAVLEGFNYIGIEKEAEYAKISEARIEAFVSQAGKETKQAVKALTKKPTAPEKEKKPRKKKEEPLPLFE